MKIAVPYEKENQMVGSHFGQSAFVKIYNIQDDTVVGDVIVPMAGQGHEAVVDFLASVHMDMVICGGIGGQARQALTARGIAVIPGVVGKADAAVSAFLTNTLRPGEGGCAHDCAGHDCGGSEHGCSGCAHHTAVQ